MPMFQLLFTSDDRGKYFFMMAAAQDKTHATLLHQQAQHISARSIATETLPYEEQKNWIASVLTTAVAAGEEPIQFTFSEDKHLAVGCSSCAPDLYGSDLEHGGSTTSDEGIWAASRSCPLVQSCCWKFYNTKLFRWLFRGGEWKDKKENYPNVEPAQNFRCGWKILQERGFTLFLLFVFTLSFIVAAFPVFIRLSHRVYIAKVDFSRINTFIISCRGCKVQMSNSHQGSDSFVPCNVNLYFPLSG